MFADYRVPVVLRQLGILQYSDQLASKVIQFSNTLMTHVVRVQITVVLPALSKSRLSALCFTIIRITSPPKPP